ncbi:YciI family protein [Lacunimicrobium album]
MKYILLSYAPENAWPPEDHLPAMQRSIELCHDLASKGQYIHAAPLQPIDKTIHVRVREGQSFVSDGPFAETKEFLAGFFLIDVPTLEDAIKIAQSLPGSTRGTTEIRPLIDLSDMNMPKSNFS